MNREMEKKLLRKSTKNMFSTEGHKFVDWESRMASTKNSTEVDCIIVSNPLHTLPHVTVQCSHYSG